jgi:hypothetical protein
LNHFYVVLTGGRRTREARHFEGFHNKVREQDKPEE